jgi:hypothetical protein
MPDSEPSAPFDATVQGAAVVYRLFDVGYAIELERAAALLAPAGAARTRPARTEGRALQIANPPVAISLGAHSIVVDGVRCRGQLAARLFDFGVCSLQVELPMSEPARWSDFVRFGQAVEQAEELATVLARELALLCERIAPAIERPGVAPVSEEYLVYRITELRNASAAPLSPELLTDDFIAPLLLGATRPLSAAARRTLLAHRFSYYADDLAVLTWENALVVEPQLNDRDVEYILEFANAQLLELRVYDALLDAELPAMYDRVADARRRRRPLPTRRFHSVLSDLQTRVADVTETIERAENALKVTDDVYLARIYGSALDLFRATAWREGIERKLSIFRETYAMLNDEAQAARTEVLELAVIAIIAAELLLGLVRAAG